MTEAEWLASDNPSSMLCHLGLKTSPRKLRLFSIACCRQVWDQITDPLSQLAVEMAERFADGEKSNQEMVLIRKQHSHCELFNMNRNAAEVVTAAISLVNSSYLISLSAEEDSRTDVVALSNAIMASRKGIDSATHMPEHPAFKLELGEDPEFLRNWKAARVSQADIIREIFGNPFRPITLNPSWLTSTVLALANSIYSEKAFHRMPVLGNALQEAGCDNAEILKHCRQPGEHCRGCWVVDQILAKD